MNVGFLGDGGGPPSAEEGLPEDTAEWLAYLSGSVNPDASDEGDEEE